MAQKRSIFEEVGADAPKAAPPPRPGGIDRATSGARGAVRLWLALLGLLVVAMVLVGGLTRLTDSGLSITEWRPVTGALPPMSDSAWEVEFEKYRAIPEYQLQNKGMGLDAFKRIYWWEWGHRQLGRVIGLVWALGLVGLLATRKIPPGWTGRLLALGVLGGAQGAIGWWMVSSGLSGDAVDVASYRLAVHLGLAFAILGLILWYVLKLARSEAALLQARRAREGGLYGMATGLMHLAFVQILLGALVAGIDAGRSFVDWPLMAGSFLPPDPFYITPLWRNFFENAGLVQFLHRMTGYLVLALAIGLWVRARKSGNRATRQAVDWAAVMVFGQVVLGIVTLLTIVSTHAAITHQLGAILAWGLILRARFYTLYPLAQSVRG